MQEKILIVDDEEILRLAMKSKLELADFVVDIASDGEEALNKLKQTEFDVVLLDIKMPGMGGIEALKLFTELFPKTDVIMLTGFADFSTTIECLKIGARDYLVKPVDGTELVTRLQSLVRARVSERGLQEIRQRFLSLIYIDLLGPLKLTRETLEKALNRSSASATPDQKEQISYALDLCEKMISKIQTMEDSSKIQTGAIQFEKFS